MDPDGPKTAPGRPRDASNNDVTFIPLGISAKNSPRDSQDLPKRPPNPPRTPPGGTPEASVTSPEASKTPLGGFQGPSKCKADVDIDVNVVVYVDGLSCIATSEVNIDQAAGGLRDAIPKPILHRTFFGSR